MKRFFLCLMVASTISLTAVYAKNDSVRINTLKEVSVVGNNASAKTPVAQTNLSVDDIRLMPTANNMPHVLWMTPSLVAFAENGTGTGYSYMRIRGVDASRINVTLNGIPQNNPESQEMYWVDIPDLASGLQQIQVQRGVGTSTHGSAAFGGSINMSTLLPGTKPYVESTTSVGSYATFQENLAAGSGILPSGLAFDVRYSFLNSDGYIRNGWCDHTSLIASLSKISDRSFVKFNYIYGKENTGITWEGISQSQFDADPTYNPAGAKPDGSWYNNESDNYWQHHFQLFHTLKVNDNLDVKTTLNYTDGFGYYEQYKQEKTLKSIGINVVDTTDLIRQKSMDNGYFVGLLDLDYHKDNLRVHGGGLYSFFDGDHYGKIIWANNNPNVPVNYEWGRNNAIKTDANAFFRADYDATDKLSYWLDMQYRYVGYKMSGLDDDDLEDMSQSRKWHFFNPKAGVFYNIDAQTHVFASVAIAHREPTRADIKDARKYGNADKIKAERMTDFELGYQFDNQQWMLGVNLYGMFYKDQLVATGKLNDVGYALMENVPNSHRTGMELQFGFKPNSWLQFDANATFSQNLVQDYTVWYDTYDNDADWGSPSAQLSKHFDEMELPYSPEVVAAIALTVKPLDKLSIQATLKHVGSQYITNSQSEDLKLPDYQHVNLSANHQFKLFNGLNAEIGIHCNNVLNRVYACNAWGYEAHFENGAPAYTEKGLYVVAPRNYLAKLSLKF